jgi:hypothetical protein
MARRWYYTHDGTKQFGPVTTAQLRELARSGALQPVSMILLEGSSRWVRAEKVKGLFSGGPIETGPSSGTLSLVLALAALLLLGGVVGLIVYRTTRPEPTRPEARAPSKEPQLFEDPPPNNLRTLSRGEQAKRRQEAEAVYLDPAKPDRDHIAAANALLYLADGPASLAKGLDVYGGDQPESRRRYRWCLQFLAVAQTELDLKVRKGVAPGIIPARDVPPMVELLRDFDPTDKEQQGRIALILAYVEKHPEHAGPAVPVLRELAGRYAGFANLKEGLAKATAAAEKHR